MSFLVKLGLIFSLFASWASCFTKFVRPPERDADQAADQDMTKNNQYADGQNILIIFDTNIKKVDLYIRQVIGTIDSVKSNGNSNPENWKAQYDISNVTENNEDCIYWFEVKDSESDGTLAESQYVNVSAPRSDETKTTTASTTSTTLTMENTMSATDTSPSNEASSTSEPNSNPGLSRGEIAGVVVGATIGGLLSLGGIGWMLWRRRARRKNDGVAAELPGDYNQDQPYSERPKSELPAEPVVLPLERPKSPPRIYEAP
ncbi:unnamed protein product [Fusarium venenatum]|uniref:Mid2 domain-containing protein n=1 Tax=Fusarium venenatum TaxID=56646 RepID=A0A2L2STY4_9HYPO|nr:uncharacterized protein FVRRES_13771 [Fusarium venenatum]CEI41848.1 unnamed protein product [Fusarium venenatum]